MNLRSITGGEGGFPPVNRLFTLVCFAVPPVLGSLVSVLWHGGALWCFAYIASGRRKLSRDRPMWLLTLLLYLYVGANVLSFLLNAPSWEEAHALIPLVTLLLFPFSYSIWSISRKDEIAGAAAVGSMVAGYSAFVIAAVQYFAFGFRPEGGAGNALVFATAACLAGAVSLAGALMRGPQWRNAMLGAYAAAVAAVLLSGSRSEWVAMALITLAIVLICRRMAWKLLLRHRLAAVIVVALVTALSFDAVSRRVDHLSQNWTEISEEGDFSSSLGYRLAMWKIGAEAFLERPLLGHGRHRTDPLIAEGMVTDFEMERSFGHFHNGFLTLLVESGIIGGGAIIAVFVVAAWIAIATLRTRIPGNAAFGATMLLIFVINYTVGGSFNIILGHDIIDTLFVIFLIVGFMLARGTSMLDETQAVEAPAPGRTAMIGAADSREEPRPA